MNTRLSSSLARLDQVARIDTMATALHELATIHGFDHMTFVVARSGTAVAHPYHCTTYPLEWTRTYLANGFVKIDPVMHALRWALLPIDWASLDWSSADARNFRRQALAHEVGPNGLSVPLRGPCGAVSLMSASSTIDGSAWVSFREQRSHEILVLSHYLNEKILRLTGLKNPEQRPRLSKRERECLTSLATGFIPKQTAALLGISESATRLYLRSARKKLGARTSHQAVARAIMLEIIFPYDS